MLENSWNPNFHKISPLFWPIIPAFNKLNRETTNWPLTNWPTLVNYNQLIDNNIFNKNEKHINFVKQESRAKSFENEYEPRIYYSGEVQTRSNNWHDFFQVMVWKTFPKTKSLLNEIHLQASTSRLQKNIRQRGKKENFVTLFDECGSIIVSTEHNKLSLVKNFNWTELFVDNKNEFGKSIECMVFGHAMFEKALSPYIGMTSHSLLISVEESYFLLSTNEKTKYLDTIVSATINEFQDLSPKNLNPFPILGVPRWHKNQTTDFYNNQSYFRLGRNKMGQPLK